MKKLKGWDAYVAEADVDDTAIELPLTEDESYLIRYPTRRQAKAIAAAQAEGDVDALLLALLGEEAGRRVAQLSEDQPAAVLDALVLDVLRGFGFAPEIETVTETEAEAGKPRKRGKRQETSSAA